MLFDKSLDAIRHISDGIIDILQNRIQLPAYDRGKVLHGICHPLMSVLCGALHDAVCLAGGAGAVGDLVKVLPKLLQALIDDSVGRLAGRLLLPQLHHGLCIISAGFIEDFQNIGKGISLFHQLAEALTGLVGDDLGDRRTGIAQL